MNKRTNLIYMLLTVALFAALTLCGGCGGGSNSGESFTPGEPTQIMVKLRAGVPLRSATVTFYDVKTGTKLASAEASANADGLAAVTVPSAFGRDLRCTAEFSTKLTSGTLSAYVPSYKEGGVICVNLVTTIADEYITKHGGTPEAAYAAVRRTLGIPDELDTSRTSDPETDVFFDSAAFLRESKTQEERAALIDRVIKTASENGEEFIKKWAAENSVGTLLFANTTSLGTNAFNVTHAPNDLVKDSVEAVKSYINEASKEAAEILAACSYYPRLSSLFFADTDLIQDMDCLFANDIEKVNTYALMLEEEYKKQSVAMNALYEEMETIADLAAFKAKANALKPTSNKFINKHNEMLGFTKTNVEKLQTVLEKGKGQPYSVISADMAALSDDFAAKTGDYIAKVLSGDNFGALLESYLNEAPELLSLLDTALSTAYRNGYISQATYFNVFTSQFAEIFKNTYCGLTVYTNCLYAKAFNDWASNPTTSLDITEARAQFFVATERAAKANKAYLHMIYELMSIVENDNIFFTNAVCQMFERSIGNVEINEWIASSDKPLHGGLALWSYETAGFPYTNGFRLAANATTDGITQTKNASGNIASPLQYRDSISIDKSFFGAMLSIDQSAADSKHGVAKTYTNNGLVYLNRYVVSPDSVVSYDAKTAWSKDRWMLGEWSFGGAISKTVNVVLQNVTTGKTIWEPGGGTPPAASADTLYKPFGFLSCFVDWNGDSILEASLNVTQNVAGAETSAVHSATGGLESFAGSTARMKADSPYEKIEVTREWLLASGDIASDDHTVTVRPDMWANAENGSLSDRAQHRFALEIDGAKKAESVISWSPASNDLCCGSVLSADTGTNAKSIVLKETITFTPKNPASSLGRAFHSTTLIPMMSNR